MTPESSVREATPSSPFDEVLGYFLRAALASPASIMFAIVVGGIIGVGLSFFVRYEYRATAVVSVVTENGAANAGLVGASLSIVGAITGQSGLGDGARQERIATLSALNFLEEFVKRHQLLDELFDERWDSASGRWRESSDEPTFIEGAKALRKSHLLVEENRKTGLVSVSMLWFSPESAATLTNTLIREADQWARSRSISDGEARLDFLNKELSNTDVVETRAAILSVMQAQLNAVMLAKVDQEYAFRFIDRAVPPLKKERVYPRRGVFGFLGILFGAVAWLSVVGFRARHVLIEKFQRPTK